MKLAIPFVCALLLTFAAHAAEPIVIPVWPGAAPGEPSGIEAEKELESKPGEKQVRRITNVTAPTLSVYLAPEANRNGAAVLIAPGGGYNILAWDLEGEEVAAWLNSIGVTGIVLKYRVPRRPGLEKGVDPPEPLQDAQRALSLVRSKATEWKIDPARLGMLGFSAGGSLTARTSVSYETRTYAKLDSIDELSCRPDFAVLIYAGGIYDEAKGSLRGTIEVTDNTPPAFLAHAHDDRVPVENSLFYYAALKKAGVPSELHVYSTGGHGFGLRPSEHACSTWPKRCEEWFKAAGVLQAKNAK